MALSSAFADEACWPLPPLPRVQQGQGDVLVGRAHLVEGLPRRRETCLPSCSLAGGMRHAATKGAHSKLLCVQLTGQLKVGLRLSERSVPGPCCLDGVGDLFWPGGEDGPCGLVPCSGGAAGRRREGDHYFFFQTDFQRVGQGQGEGDEVENLEDG